MYEVLAIGDLPERIDELVACCLKYPGCGVVWNILERPNLDGFYQCFLNCIFNMFDVGSTVGFGKVGDHFSMLMPEEVVDNFVGGGSWIGDGLHFSRINTHGYDTAGHKKRESENSPSPKPNHENTKRGYKARFTDFWCLNTVIMLSYQIRSVHIILTFQCKLSANKKVVKSFIS